MSNPTWPAALPQFALEQGYSEKLPDQVLETSMDSGPPKARRRFTTNTRPFGMVLEMDAEQSEIFEQFFFQTLGAGVKKFDWVHPRTRVAATFRFRRPPPQASVQGEIVRWTIALEIVS